MPKYTKEYPVKSEWFPAGRRKAAALLRRAVPLLREAVLSSDDPSVTAIAKQTRSPFRILVSTVVSARTKDEVTGAASERLFARAKGPAEMARLRESEIAKLIYPAGFYRTKAKAIRALSKKLVDEYGGRVPRTIEELVELPPIRSRIIG